MIQTEAIRKAVSAMLPDAHVSCADGKLQPGGGSAGERAENTASQGVGTQKSLALESWRFVGTDL